MTNQEKKEFLRQYRVADHRLTALFDELAGWRSRAVKITPSLSGMPGRGAENPLLASVERIVELEEKIDQEIVRMMQIRAEIREAVGTVRDNKLRLLLE
ncbi:hypothetical protein [Anaerotruncus colihominis]|uniref:hypothetical protein n=1 Tax=Anaerotruncus colihominis TaxID=169435 RepID=UPI003515E48F